MLGMTEQGIKVILDSNFLFIPLKFRVDILDELNRLFGGLVQCVIPSPILEELQLLKKKVKPSQRREIDFALDFAENCGIVEENIKCGETVDDLIVRLASGWRCPVATNDIDLRHRLRSKGLPVIYLRQKAYLEVDGAI